VKLWPIGLDPITKPPRFTPLLLTTFRPIGARGRSPMSRGSITRAHSLASIRIPISLRLVTLLQLLADEGTS
jgi:hypothetical protein